MKKMAGLLAAALRKTEMILKPSPVHAHCDIPCGIYETNSMTTAADTVAKMVEKILEIKPDTDPQKDKENRNSLIRMVHVKEEHAQKCKQEILILWTDYFKDEHLAKFPNLHAKVWKATKLCSHAKRTVDMNVALQLKSSVAEIAQIFAATKK